MAITAQDWLSGRCEAVKEIARRAARSGPRFEPKAGPALWHDQFFAREVAPAGVVNCEQALRVGATQQALQISIIASHANEGDLILPAGATITLNLLQGDAEHGVFEDVGPTTCVKVPDQGKTVSPDGLVYSFTLGDFTKPWLMASLEFEGAIAGGNVDVALSYAAR